MRIAHLVATDSFAGVEQYVASLAAGQSDRGHEVTVLGCDSARFAMALAGRPVRHRRAAGVGDAIRALGRLPRPDILHVHMTAAEIAAAFSPRHFGVPLVATRHFAQRRGSTRAAAAAGRLAARRVRAQIAVSSYVAEHVEGESVVVHPGVPSQDTVSEAHRNRVVLVVQRLEAEKQTEVALLAFAASKLAADGWRLHIAGDGSRLQPLRALAEGLGIQARSRFLGQRGDVDVLMGRSGILLATPTEAFGIAVVEAMSHALPVVAARAGGHLETVGVASRAAMFDPGDVEGAAAALEALAHDERGRVAYGEELQMIQRARFTLERHAADVERVYRSVR